MGYYTSHRLNITGGGKKFEIIEDLRESYEDANYAIDESGATEESCKWYSHDRDMIEFSKKYPESIFELSGQGEEPEDTWRHYFKNGKSKMIKARIVFDDFNEGDLV